MPTNNRIRSAHMLIERLERLSADSYWAHQASGLRGSLLRCLEDIEQKPTPGGIERLDRLMDMGFSILQKAAAEMRALDS